MKKTRIALTVLMFLFLLGVTPCFFTATIAAAQVPKEETIKGVAVERITKKTVKKLSIDLVTTGSALKTGFGKAYDIKLTGVDSFVIPLRAEQAGVFRFFIKETGGKNTKSLSFSVYQDKECQNPVGSFVFDGSKKTKMIGRVPLPKKGYYYLEFKSDLLKKADSVSYLLTSSMIQGQDGILKEGEFAFVGAGSNKPIYYEVVLTEDAVVAVKGTRPFKKGKTYVSLCDKDKKKISKTPVLLNEETLYFPAKKGTYFLEMQPETGNVFSVRTLEIPISDRSGATKETALLLKSSKLETGMIIESDLAATEKWYKIKLTKSEKLEIECYGGVSSSGTVRVEFFDAAGKRFGEKIVTKRNEDISFQPSITYRGKNEKKSGYLPAGTYFIRITKAENETAGYYSLRYRVQPGSRQ